MKAKIYFLAMAFVALLMVGCSDDDGILKIVYSFDYGKKTSKSPDYKHQNSESAILK